MTFGDEPALRRAQSACDWDAVRALRFDALEASGEAPRSAARAFADPFDEAVNTTTYVLMARGHAVGTTRASLTAARLRAALPLQRVFARELEAAFGADAAIVEASLTFLDPRAGLDPQEALLRLFKVHAWRCAAENADALVIAVRDTQIGFYRRRFNMEILSGAEPWPGMPTPRVLMGLAWRAHAASLLRRLPTLAASGEEVEKF